MSPLDPQVPPTGEEIHLPGPSILPLLTAVGITLLLLGITLGKVLLVAGAVITVACVIRWVRDTRRDVDELPLG